MQLTQQASMRMEQRQLLTPRMIQSMEILQLPLMALEERIEQEIQSNPVLELRDGADADEPAAPSEASHNGEQAGSQEDRAEGEQQVGVKGNDDGGEFERVGEVSDDLE